MSLIRYRDGAGQVCVGVLESGAVHRLDVPDMATVLRHRITGIAELTAGALAAGPAAVLSEVTLLAPVDGRTEVWGAGVTYLRSRTARMEESRHQRVYDDVYDAERPELFFKAAAWRVRTDGEPAGLRADCTDTVAEPELALVLNQYAEIVGAVVCNDLTARGVEAENPIYLPQAKLYQGSCVLSPAIVPWSEITGPDDLTVSIEVHRDGVRVFGGQAGTAAMKRGYTELVEWLFRAESFPDGAVLSTGTGIVPPLGDGLLPGDTVRVGIDQVGEVTSVMALVGTVREGAPS